MSRVLICDIDGVVCDSSARISRFSDVAALERGDYNAFRVSMHVYGQSSTDEDIPIHHGIKLLHSLLEYHEPEHLFFLTSRGNESRGNTLKWLRNHVFDWLDTNNLIMRPEYRQTEPGVFWREGEPRFDHIEFKKGVVLKLLDEGAEVVMAIDDHAPICEMYQEVGIPALVVKFPGVDCITSSGMKHVEAARAERNLRKL